MRWEDERYVRSYTRDTVDWLALSLEAQALWLMLLRKFDRAGIIHLGRQGKRGLAVTCGHADRWDVLEPAVEELLRDGCLVIEGDKAIAPNFIEAQEAVQSDAARKRTQRERQRDKILSESREHRNAAGLDILAEQGRAVTPSVTRGHEPSRDVTRGHAVTKKVTPSLAVPSRAVPKDSVPAGPPRPSRMVLEHYSKVTGLPAVFEKRDYQLIEKQLGNGFTPDELMQAADGIALDDWPERDRQKGVTIVYGTADQVRKFIGLGLSQTRRQQPVVQIPQPDLAPPTSEPWRAAWLELKARGIGRDHLQRLLRLEQVSDGAELRLRAPDAFTRDWLAENMRGALSEAAGKPVRLEVVA